MSTILLEGKPVAEAIYDKALKTAKALEAQGVTPVVALVRVGENPADISYENSIKKNMAKGGVSAVSATLSQGTTTEKVLETIDTLNKSPLVHGIMLFRLWGIRDSAPYIHPTPRTSFQLPKVYHHSREDKF